MEEAAFVSALADGTMADTEFTDELFSRCRDAIIAAPRTGNATPLDVAVLIRQVMRRGSERDGIPFRMVLGPEAGSPPIRRSGGAWESPFVQAARRSSAARGRAVPAMHGWRPEIAVDAAAAAGTPAGRRAVAGEPLTADPFFVEATGYPPTRRPGSGRRSARPSPCPTRAP